ncbi:MAG TPA: histidine phosphatase family protein, partial [Bacteroidales bacterium]|nr:histidine phosphatase family protein [Bacteroidales bacterium]
MSKQLILLRHGIAESRAEDGTDFNRKLTDEGIEKLKKRLPNIRHVLEFPDKIEIWSSPLRRAKETAEILS